MFRLSVSDTGSLERLMKKEDYAKYLESQKDDLEWNFKDKQLLFLPILFTFFCQGYRKILKIVLVIFNQIYFSDFLNLQPKWHYGGTRKAEILR